MNEVFSTINKQVKTTQGNNKKLYNKKVFASILLPNDRVLDTLWRII